MVGLATAKTPCGLFHIRAYFQMYCMLIQTLGPYAYKGSWKPFGADSRDMGLFVDSKSPYSYIFQQCLTGS